MFRLSKIFAAIVLGIQIIPMLVFVFIQIYKLTVKIEMKHALTVSSLEKYIIEPSKIRWVEEGREMLVNGVMFDVYSYKLLPGGSIEVFGLTDHREQAINNQSNYLVKRKKQLQNFLVKLIVVQSIGVINHACDFTVKIAALKTKFFSPKLKLKLVYNEIVSPPPQLLIQ